MNALQALKAWISGPPKGEESIELDKLKFDKEGIKVLAALSKLELGKTAPDGSEKKVSVVFHKDGQECVTISQAGLWDKVKAAFGSAKIYDVSIGSNEDHFKVTKYEEEMLVDNKMGSVLRKNFGVWKLAVNQKGDVLTAFNVQRALLGAKLDLSGLPAGGSATSKEMNAVKQTVDAVTKEVKREAKEYNDKRQDVVAKVSKTEAAWREVPIPEKRDLKPDFSSNKKVHCIHQDADKDDIAAFVVGEVDKRGQGEILYMSACGPKKEVQSQIVKNIQAGLVKKIQAGSDSSAEKKTDASEKPSSIAQSRNCEYYIESFVTIIEAMKTPPPVHEGEEHRTPEQIFDERLTKIAFSVPDPGARTALRAVVEHYGIDASKVLMTTQQPQDICAALPSEGKVHYVIPLGGGLASNVNNHLRGRNVIDSENYQRLCCPETLEQYSADKETGIFGFHEDLNGQKVVTLSSFSPFKFLSLLLSKKDRDCTALFGSDPVTSTDITFTGIKGISFNGINKLLKDKFPEGVNVWNPDTGEMVKLDTVAKILIQAVEGSTAMTIPESKRILVAALVDAGVESDNPPGKLPEEFLNNVSGQPRQILSTALGEWQLQHMMRKAKGEQNPSDGEVVAFMMYKMMHSLCGPGIAKGVNDKEKQISILQKELEEINKRSINVDAVVSETDFSDEEAESVSKLSFSNQEEKDRMIGQLKLMIQQLETSKGEFGDSAAAHISDLENYEKDSIAALESKNKIYEGFQKKLDEMQKGSLPLQDQLALLMAVSHLARTHGKTYLAAALVDGKPLANAGVSSVHYSRFTGHEVAHG